MKIPDDQIGALVHTHFHYFWIPLESFSKNFLQLTVDVRGWNFRNDARRCNGGIGGIKVKINGDK